MKKPCQNLLLIFVMLCSFAFCLPRLFSKFLSLIVKVQIRVVVIERHIDIAFHDAKSVAQSALLIDLTLNFSFGLQGALNRVDCEERQKRQQQQCDDDFH